MKLNGFKKEARIAKRKKKFEPEIAAMRAEMMASPEIYPGEMQVGHYVMNSTYHLYQVVKITHGGKRVMGKILMLEGEEGEILKLDQKGPYRLVSKEWVEKAKVLQEKVHN